MSRVRYVLIGNSAAGIGAVEGIRQIDKQGEIIVITNEPYHTYSRPLISYLLMGKTNEQRMKYRDDEFYSRNGYTLLAGKKANQVKPEEKQVVLEDGSVIPYDKLLVGTGASAFVPPIEGLDTVSQKFTFMSLKDAHKLSEALSKNKKVLILGAGLIGLKCAEGILDKVKSITVIDLAPRILSSILDEEGAGLVQGHLEHKGLAFRLGTGAKSFDGNRALFDTGDSIDFDILVLAVGVRPNTALLSGIADIDKGIVINGKSETSVKDIYAAGDCTETKDISSGCNRIMALLPNAYIQGECAGINMAGGHMTFDKAIPMNAVGFFGLPIITAGNYTGDVYAESCEGRYKRLFYSNNRLNGYILIGNVDKAGIYTNLIRESIPLDSIDFELICQQPGLMAFTKEDREKTLGGVT